MASRQFFDPMVVLAATPLVSSTCTLLFARDQYLFLSLLNKPSTRAYSKPLLRPYFTHFFRPGLTFVLGAISVSFWSGLGNMYLQSRTLRAAGTYWWYTAGAALACSHLLFVPIIIPSIQGIMDDGEDKDQNGQLDEWLSIHTVRSLSVDLAAFVAFAVAAFKTLRV